MVSRLHDLDTALIQARRLFEVPAMITDDGRRIEASTLLVLAALERLGDGPTIADVAAWLTVSHSTASRLIARAVATGTITRAPSATDRREQVLTTTPHGRDLAARASAYRQARLAQLLDGWSEDETDTLAKLITRLASLAT